MSILEFWGKAQPADPESGPRWHPLAFHSLDVAAAGAALLERHTALAARIYGLLALAPDAARGLLPFLLALHDIGKFAKRFQAKAPAHYPACLGRDPTDVSTYYDHGAGGFRLFCAYADNRSGFLDMPFDGAPEPWRPLISAVAGHHGAPPQQPDFEETPRLLRGDFGKPGIEAACTFAAEARALFMPSAKWPELREKPVRRASWAIAGLAVLADWIGSNQRWFPYRDAADFGSLTEYLDYARERAGRAVEQAGVLPAKPARAVGYDALIGAENAPTPMQERARDVELPPGPALFIVEDATGAGKTEAALMLAHRLIADGRADGLYVALPTMATANAMFDRLGAAHRGLFAAGECPSVALAHGARSLHPGFRRADLPAGRAERAYSGGGEDGAAETTASTACAAWIADDRRLTFLADAGAGTIDQALYGVLPSRHQALRLLGLMRRVLVLDEVHAYDAYMLRELGALLEFQAGLGGSAIVLSATLPLDAREKLERRFRLGLGERDPDTAAASGNAEAWPRAAVCAAGVQAAVSVPAWAARSRTLPVRFLRAPEEAFDAAERAAREGKAVLYIRNAVDDALEAHAELTARGLAPDLFHSRFALVDRLEIEERIVYAFGKKSAPAQRRGKVLVATQVVEQSLDLDFDAMVTDLAPIDLLIQRAGRLWRHKRAEREGSPELLVMGPEPTDDPGDDWFSAAFPRAAYVYRNHARLWLTARAVERAGAIDSPNGVRALVEAVYGADAEACIPAALKANFVENLGRAGAEHSVAQTNVLRFAAGFMRDGRVWDSDVRTPTRLEDDPRVTLRLARVRGGRVVPYALDAAPGESWRAWRLSEVAAPARRVGGERTPTELAKAVKTAKADWSRFDEHKVMVVLQRNETGDSPLFGEAAGPGERAAAVSIGYDRLQGLTFFAAGAK